MNQLRWLLTWEWSALLRHPLFIALFQLLLGGFGAYLLTERWQRWRQRRDFQYKAMANFSRVGWELARQLQLRRLSKAKALPPEDVRPFMSQWLELQSIRDEMTAVFKDDVISAFEKVNKTVLRLRDMNRTSPGPTDAEFNAVWDRLVSERGLTTSLMIIEMDLGKAKVLKASVKKRMDALASENRAQAKADAQNIPTGTSVQ